MNLPIPRRALLTLATALITTPTRSAPPSTPSALYQATAIVTGTDTRQRPAGFADCLTQVLLKLTATPALRTDPALTPLKTHAADLVDHFTYVDARAALLHHDDQGTYDRPHELTVWFDPPAVDAAIARLGLRIWPQPRPLLLPVILVRTKDPDPFLLSAEAATPQAAAMRAALIRIAAAYGLGTHIPTDTELAEWAVDTIGPPAPLGIPAENHLTVAGTLSFDIKQTGWTGSWTATIQGREQHWEVHGVGFDQAFQNLADGAVERATKY